MSGNFKSSLACQNWYQNFGEWTQEHTTFQIRPAQKTDMQAVNHLRASAFTEATEFRLRNVEPVLWNAEDDSALILNVVEANGEIVATMRGVVLTGKQAIEAQLEARIPPSLKIDGPVMILERGATRSDLRGKGLNSILRIYFLKWAVRHHITKMLGSVYAGAPRTGVMQAIGYRFHNIVEDLDQWPVENLSPRMIAELDLDLYGQHAINILEKKHGGMLTSKIL